MSEDRLQGREKGAVALATGGLPRLVVTHMSLGTDAGPLSVDRIPGAEPLPGEGVLGVRVSREGREARAGVWVRAAGDAAAMVEVDVDGQPDPQRRASPFGSLVSQGSVVVRLEIPGLGRMLALHMFCDWWSRPWFGASVQQVPERTQALLAELQDGQYLVLLPLAGSDGRATLRGDGEGLVLDVSLWDTGRWRVQGPVLAASVDSDPYRALAEAARVGARAVGTRLREEKPYPEPLEYLGFCSWDAFYQQVHEAGLKEKAREFQQLGVPVRWFLIDDGWQILEGSRLRDFGADPEKFPGGLFPHVADLKRAGLRWVGLWHAFTGHWGGVAPGSPLALAHREHLLESKHGALVPAPDAAKGFAFWHAWHGEMARAGIDFIKVDNQGALYHHTQGVLPVGRAAREAQQALQASAGLHFRGRVINCMSMTAEAVWHFVTTNVTRSSDDFYPRQPEGFASHLLQNVYNSLWLGQLSWCDYDMWWTRHPDARRHAVLRAVSGGPVYVSDPVGQTAADELRPLVLSDGRVLRASRPAAPAPDALLSPPEERGGILAVQTLAAGGGGVALFHVGREMSRRATGPEDVPGLKARRVAVHEHFTGQRGCLAVGEAWDVSLAPGEVRLLRLAPVEDGVACLGLVDKYLSVAAARRAGTLSSGALYELLDGGRVLLYSEHPEISVWAGGRRVPLTREGEWYELSLPEGQGWLLEVRWG